MNFRLDAIIGDITEVDTDAIVNAANNGLWMGSGVAGAIKRAGGEEIEREAVAKGPITLGSAVATGAGTLPHRRVIHAAAMGFDGGSMLPATADSVRSATSAALQVADEEGITSLAFPALGTGVGGFSIDDCAEVMVTVVSSYLERTGDTSISRVVFVLRDDSARGVFRRAIEQLS